MNVKRTLTCIVCPVGCELEAEINDGKVTGVSGASCKRGTVYANEETTAPKRMLTTTVAYRGGPPVPVKTSRPIPKESLFEALEVIKALKLKQPPRYGEVIIKNILGSGADVAVTGDRYDDA